jgi:hypothetical protein
VKVEDIVEAHLERAVEHLSAVKHGQIPDHRVDAHLVKKTPGTSAPGGQRVQQLRELRARFCACVTTNLLARLVF